MDVLLVHPVGVNARKYSNALTCCLSERERYMQSTCFAFDTQLVLAINNGVEHRDCAFS